MYSKLKNFCILLISFALIVGATVLYLYKTTASGILILRNVPGVCTITREDDTGIAHIRGDSLQASLYCQGFAHAQTRLWQMERTRRIFNGRLSEIFGEDALAIDKFSRTLGYRRIAEETWKTISEEKRKIFQSYCDGINDFLDDVKLSLESHSAKLLPPEFYVFGLADKIEPWTPVDSLAALNLIKFSLTWDWPKDFLREILKSESSELAEIADELVPYTSEYLHKLVTVLDDDDVKRMGKWSDTTLADKYKQNQQYLKEAEPNRSLNKKFVQESIKQVLDGIQIDEHAHHSNNWVIHGNHTATGLPMLANDPHLSTSLPSFWQLIELVWEDKFLIGGAVPGIPLVGIGRTKNISWGQTSPLCDTSDLWQEDLNEQGTKYKVDGEWRDLKIIKETIFYKGKQGNQSITIDVKLTHRGVIMTPELIYNAEVLFGSALPEGKMNSAYSLAWGGQYPGESFMDMVLDMASGKGVSDLMNDFNNQIEESYRGINMNLVLADNQGDIGYVMLAPFPNRKDKTPYVGNRVLDGTTSAYDWEGLLSINKLPQSLNPKKGYIATANNRQMPDNSDNDIGASSMSTGRSLRIEEMIQQWISTGHKITYQDMSAIQQDDTDVIARDLTPKLIKIVESIQDELTQEQLLTVESMFKHLRSWQGKFDELSIGATVYSYTLVQIYDSLLHNYLDAEKRSKIVDNYEFVDFFVRLIEDTFNNSQKFSKFCQSLQKSYQGKNQCAYNIALAFNSAYQFLQENISQNEHDWLWRNVHSNDYPNMPWSRTPLKMLLHRNTKTFGNTNTPHVSKTSFAQLKKDGKFISSHSAGYKQIIQHGQSAATGKNMYSVDTGNDGNMLAGNYFAMNHDHLSGKLHRMYFGYSIQEVPTHTLTLNRRQSQIKQDKTEL